MVPTRITNPRPADLQGIDERLAKGEAFTVQFDTLTYTDELLRKLDSLAAAFRNLLEIRFYGHYAQTPFDCSTIEKIPAVTNLSVDCLTRATSIEALAQLGCLEQLSLGVFELSDSKILRYPNLRSLRKLTLGETKTKALELSFLAELTKLTHLHICGHAQGIVALKALPSLTSLSLDRIGKQTALGFLSEMQALRSLSLLLGGRSSIEEIATPGLQEIEIHRVNGLTELGDLARFPELVSLIMHNQPRVERMVLSPSNAKLSTIRVFDCKSFRELPGLETLPRLQELRLGTTALDPEALLALKLPSSLEFCAMYTGKEREEKRLQAALAERGYREFPPRPGDARVP